MIFQAGAARANFEMDHMEHWSKDDASEAESSTLGNLSAHSNTQRALAVYYRHKRLLNQGAYFDRKGKQAGASWAVKMRHQRERIFFVTIGFVLFHFAADYLAGRMEQQHHAETARAWELASLLPLCCP